MKNVRYLVQAATVVFALSLAVMPRREVLALVVVLGALHLALLERAKRSRDATSDTHPGLSLQPVNYWLAVFLLVALFPPAVAAAGWSVAALAEGLSRFLSGRRETFTARDEMAAYFLLSFTGISVALVLLTAWPQPAIFLYALVTALFVAVAVGVRGVIDLTLLLPLGAALFLYSLTFAGAPAIDGALFLPALIVNLVLAIGAYAVRSIDVSGAVGGFAIGFALYVFLGPPGFVVMFTFFLAGSAASKVGYSLKHANGVGQEKKGARSFKHALANCVIGVYLAFLAVGSGDPRFVVGFVGSFAATLADTISSELGQLVGQRPRLITTFELVPLGTDGGVTFSGTMLGVLAASLLGMVAMVVDLILPAGLWIVVGAGFAGTSVDSILGALYERKKKATNEAVNFFCALSGGLFGVFAAGIV